MITSLAFFLPIASREFVASTTDLTVVLDVVALRDGIGAGGVYLPLDWSDD